MTSAGFSGVVLALSGTLPVGCATGSLARAWSGLRSPQAAKVYAAITMLTIAAIKMTGNRSERLDRSSSNWCDMAPQGAGVRPEGKADVVPGVRCLVSGATQ